MKLEPLVEPRKGLEVTIGKALFTFNFAKTLVWATQLSEVSRRTEYIMFSKTVNENHDFSLWTLVIGPFLVLFVWGKK